MKNQWINNPVLLFQNKASSSDLHVTNQLLIEQNVLFYTHGQWHNQGKPSVDQVF